MSDFYKKLRDLIKYLFSTIDYLTVEEKAELYSFIEYFVNKSVYRKFNNNFVDRK